MKAKLKDRRGDFLFALNIFVAFLLLFESHLVIPRWLQPLGRMHPLVLHFPIVLLLLAMVMEFFRFKSNNHANEFYQRFTSALLLTGVVSSGITVVMGIFLSQEQGYQPAVISWHKFWGSSVFFVSSFIYTCRDFRWYKRPIARAGAILTTLCLVFAGHFGGALTHGDNFIWQPVMAADVIVPFEEAIVFEHVIRPVFSRKCAACHNAEKIKGQLMLTDSVSVMQGGKTGELFVAGQPENSLLIKRLQLAPEHKKHMPPAGKPQLTPEEFTLLYHWVKTGAPMGKKVMALAESDSLRIAAAKVLASDESPEEVFPFSAASRETLQKLNSNYRVVSPIARHSPALAVNIYNKDSYGPRSLEELKEVKLQIISLNLSKMPVEDEDLHHITPFENLRRLNLNFTEVTGTGIAVLSKLDQLQALSLSGTKVNYDDLRKFIPLSKRLKALAIWDTDISPAEIEKLKTNFKHIDIMGGMTNDEMPAIKLNPPKLKNRSVVFGDTISVELFHPVKGVEIRFTTDGSDPDSISSTAFERPLRLTASTEIKTRAFKEGWRSSDPGILMVYRSAIKPDTAMLLSRLSRVHTASGARTFFDHELGSFNANSPAWANNWAGFINNDMELLVGFETAAAVSSVSLNALIETENFIFPPAVIEVWGGASPGSLTLITRYHTDLPTSYRKPFIKLFQISFPKQHVSFLKIVARPVMKLPKWHRRKGKPALLLIDEILIN